MNEELLASQSRMDPQKAEDGRSTEIRDVSEGDPGKKKIVVRHNKKEVRLTMDELIRYAEKGLDYDRIRPSHDFLKKLAQKNGETDISQYIGKVSRKWEDGRKEPEAPSGDGGTQGEAPTGPERERTEAETPDQKSEEAEKLEGLQTSYELLLAKYEALKSNIDNRAASIGSLSGSDGVEKDFYSSQEWDRLSRRQKEKLIQNGRIYEFMKKWSVER